MRLISRIKPAIINFVKYLRDGGVVYVNVSFTKPNERFVSKKVVVVGGTSGIGLEIAKEFLAEGAEVLICARNQQKLETTKNKLDNPRLHIMSLDVSNVSIIPEKIKQADSAIGNIDIFINCAGVTDYSGNSSDKEEMYDYILDINQKGLFFMCKSQGEYLKSKRIQGKIINITSKAGELIQYDPYTLSKWGANCITKGLARKLAKDQITVNGIAPGCVPTNISAELQSYDINDNAYQDWHNTKRFTLVQEVASLTLYLASDAAKNIVGQIINIDGGIY